MRHEHLTEREALAEMERLRAQRDAALELRKPLATFSGGSEGDARNEAIRARLMSPIAKMERTISRAIKQIQAAKNN